MGIKMRSKMEMTYTDECLSNIAYPLGGMGAGMFCLEGTGVLSKFSLRHCPDVPSAPNVFAALAIKDGDAITARVLEGNVPRRKIWNDPNVQPFQGIGAGLSGRNYGLPRFADCRFSARFPFAQIALNDATVPVAAEITGWSPFIPGDDVHSCLPCAALEYTLRNTGDKPLDCVFYFTSHNMMETIDKNGYVTAHVAAEKSGFTLSQSASSEKPWEEGHLRVICDHPGTCVDTALFRGGWFDTFTMIWNQIQAAVCANKQYDEPDARSIGGTLAAPLSLAPGEHKTLRLYFSWYVPHSNLRCGEDVPGDNSDTDGTGDACGTGDTGDACDTGGTGDACGTGETGDACDTGGTGGTDAHAPVPTYYAPWYATRFTSIDDVSNYFLANAAKLRDATKQFTDTLFASDLPDAILEAVNANLCILKSPTVLRQQDGRLWCWEGCNEREGSCPGTCTHVWNYAQALCHLFPALERTLRQTEFNENQDERGHQQFRASLPIRPMPHHFHAAADGQLGGIMKVYRDWRISGDTDWMLSLWPKVKQSLEYCIHTWDPEGKGVVIEPHHNTYDIEFYGAEPMCTTMYLGALKAAALMAEVAGETETAARYEALRTKGAAYAVAHFYNGEYMEQRIAPIGGTGDGGDQEEMPVPAIGGYLSPEAVELIKREGPKYQYGSGCLSDGVIGAWMAALYGLGDVMDAEPVRRHLHSIFTYNLKEDLSAHSNTQRPGYALGTDGGLLLCTWPRGGKLSLPFVYSDEVWTGIEYQVASHLLLEGFTAEGEKIVKTCRARYDGRDRNPFDEYECGHWYARALASYALLQSYAGARYDKVTRTLYLRPAVSGDVQALLAFDGGYGLAGVKNGEPFFTPVSGDMVIDKIAYTPHASTENFA